MNELRALFRLNDIQLKALKRLGIETPEDMLLNFPTRYASLAGTTSVKNLADGDQATLYGTLKKLETAKGFRSKIPMAKGAFTDGTGTLQLVFLHQPYLAKMIPAGSSVKLSGKVSAKNGALSMINPKIERAESVEVGGADSLFSGKDEDLMPMYREARGGISSEWLRHSVAKLLRLRLHERIIDPIPSHMLKQYHLPSLATALVWIHTPKSRNDAEAARKRFAFEEIFFIQIERQQARREWEHHPSYLIKKSRKDLDGFINKFPYALTSAQEKTIADILKDFAASRPMARLIEGDVGSGKTAVAAAAVEAVVSTRPTGQNFGTLQAAYMAPTEILATQHFESFINYFIGSGIQIALITGSGCRKFPSKVNPRTWTTISRSQLLKWVANGEIPVVIGTHALIQKSVKWKHLALAVIDEQHRFGTKQRQSLVSKSGTAPHLLSMTATPIPRTLALTLFGDLDLSLLDEMPPGRKPVETKIIRPDKRDEAYEMIRKELAAGRQAYVICPRIDEPDPAKEQAMNAKSVVEEAKRLQKDVFKEYVVAAIHGKMRPAEKDAIMRDFAANKSQILVATSVIEVGVNVPNATSIIIEGAERFGLAQLHQLRGRVMRGTHQPRCFIFSESKSEATATRLGNFTKAKNGFELAEFDLMHRGAGDLSGARQWGLDDLGMEALKNLKMVEAARTEARAIVDADPDLLAHPQLRQHITLAREKIHFE